MSSIREVVWLRSPADLVWQMIGDPASVQEWVPSVSSSTMKGNLRTVNLKRGGSVVEEVVTLDHALRRLQYSVREGLPVEHHLATVDVIEVGPRECLVVYSTDIGPESFAQAIGATIRSATRILGDMFGTAERPTG